MKARARRVAPGGSGEPHARAALAARLRERREEIEEAVRVRAYGVADPGQVADPEYLQGLRAAVSAAVEYGLASVEGPGSREPPIPAALLVQARVAARNRIPLDTVLRRYFAGYVLLGEYLLEEAEDARIGTDLKSALRDQAALLDRLLAAVSDEHQREAASRTHTLQQRRVERVERLLAGESVDATALEYELETFHVGVVGHGEAAVAAARELAQRFDRRLLLVRSDAERFWAWLGSRRRTTPEVMAELLEASSGRLPPGDILAFGEPSEGFPGWRLTHQQAKAALPVARATEESVVRYSDVAMLASVLQDEVVAASLRQLYLDPLQGGADGGMVLRETLKAYFAAGGHSSSTAAALGVTRRTIRNRLKVVEERVGASVDVHAAEFRTALLLAELDGQSGQT